MKGPCTLADFHRRIAPVDVVRGFSRRTTPTVLRGEHSSTAMQERKEAAPPAGEVG
jgi:hypothetical protein